MPECKACGKHCEDFDELAKHILGAPKSTHRHGRIWATRYIHRHLINKRDFKTNLVPPTDKQMQNLEGIHRPLSGKQECVTTLCQTGRHTLRQYLPVEYIQSQNAHRIKGRLVVTCEKHSRR